MSTRTRNFVIVSLVILGVGVGSGLFAYLTRSASALAAAGPEDLRFVPREAALVAFADVRAVMASELRQKTRRAGLTPGNGAGSLQGETGINPEADVDRLVFGTMAPGPGQAPSTAGGVILARGRFDVVKIERAMRDRGAQVEDYGGIRVVTAGMRDRDAPPPSRSTPPVPDERDPVAVAFLEPGLIAFGESRVVRRAIDAGRGGENVLRNDDLVTRMKPLDGQTIWAVGRFDALPARPPIAQGVLAQVPSISWFSASGRIDAGVKATFTAETLDEAAANGLRDVVRGLLALGRMQSASRPEYQSLLQSVQIGGAGTSVTFSMDLSPQTLDLLTEGLRPPIGALP